MFYKRLLAAVVILVCGFWTLSPAFDLGAGAGYGNYTLSAYGYSYSGGGVSVALNADFPIGSSPVLTSTSLSYWSGSFGAGGIGVTLTDITVAQALKVRLLTEEAPVRPYFGVQVAYHFLSAVGVSSKDFGIGGFGGVAFRVAPTLRIPVQVGYDHIFESGASAGAITIRAGVLFTFGAEGSQGYRY